MAKPAKITLQAGSGTKIPLSLPEPLNHLIRKQSATQGGRTLTSIIHEILLKHFEKQGNA